MAKMFLFFLTLISTCSITGQVIINLQLPPGGITLKSQLWNLSLVNTSNDEPNVKMQVLVSDVMTNQPIFSGSSRVFRLKKGVHLIQLAEISPVVYNVLQAGYNIDANPNGFLPIGNFSVCYRVTRLVSDESEQLSEECETVQIEPLSPPMLKMPFDEEDSETPRPIFTWTPPSPYQLFSRPAYDLVLVQVAGIQNSSQAIQQNIPIYRASNVNDNVHAYPTAMPELDTSKLYAWQITAKSRQNAVAKSEIWTFRVKPVSTQASVVKRKPTHYAKLKREKDGSFTICKGILHFEYLNEANDNLIKCSITDISSSSKKQAPVHTFDHPVTFGQNLIDINLESIQGMKYGKIYLLEIVTNKGEKWYLKFEFKKAD